jgi:hypothetical protein
MDTVEKAVDRRILRSSSDHLCHHNDRNDHVISTLPRNADGSGNASVSSDEGENSASVEN